MYGSDSSWWAMIIGLIGFGIAIGCALAFGLPWLWSLIKPLLHAVTA
jgi:hypothetical protein